MTIPIPLPSKYFRAYLKKGWIKTGKDFLNIPVHSQLNRLERLQLIEPVKDKYFFTEQAGAYGYGCEAVEYIG